MFNKSTNITRVLIIISGVLFFTSFLFPLWQISLWAPQYPEGLSLQIWTSKFTGDVQTVNTLNHYVGMHPINAESFPELNYFPKIFLVLGILGIVVGIIGRKILNYLWLIIVISFSAWAFYDFYSWEYKFGHELNPDAPIKMEDMVYQPPVIGEKQFLNISASSYPEFAGYALILSTLLTLGAAVITFKKNHE